MRSVAYTGSFKKDYKAVVKRGCNMQLFEEVVNMLVKEEVLPPKYRDHALRESKQYKESRECHIMPDWLLIYSIEDSVLILRATGTHSDLFRR